MSDGAPSEGHAPDCMVRVLHEDDDRVLPGSHCSCGHYQDLAARQMAVEDEEEFHEADNGDAYGPCSCRYCSCANHVEGGGVCGDCFAGAHQG